MLNVVLLQYTHGKGFVSFYIPFVFILRSIGDILITTIVFQFHNVYFQHKLKILLKDFTAPENKTYPSISVFNQNTD